MNAATFNALVESRLEKVKSILLKKAEEYATDDDRFHNFKVAARAGVEETSPEDALWGMALKHHVSVMDMIRDSKSGKASSASMINEKIGDLINYLILLEGLLIERSEAKK